MEDLASSSPTAAQHRDDGSCTSVTTDNALLVKLAPSQQLLQQQNANDDPSMHARRRNLLGSPSLLMRPLTATVLDLHLLDEYLLKGFLAPTLEQTLCSLVVAVNNNNNNSNKLKQWIRTWTLPLLGTFTLLWSQGQLPTTRALGLAMVHRRSTNNSKTSIRMRLLAYAALRYGLPALYQTLRQILQQRERKLNEWRTRTSTTNRTTTSTATQRTGQSSPSLHDEHNIAVNGMEEKIRRKQQEFLALQRQCSVLIMVLEGVDRFLPCLRLACLLQCWAGWSTTPEPAMVLTGWEYHATNVDNNNNNNHLFNTQYAHRRWLWEQGLETLQLWLAGIALVRSTWGPWVEAHVVRPVAYVGRRLQSAILAFPPNRKQPPPNRHCPLCRCCLAASAVVVQAQPCGHLYCYVCLYRASTSTTSTAASDATHSNKFSCHVCGTVITTASAV